MQRFHIFGWITTGDHPDTTSALLDHRTFYYDLASILNNSSSVSNSSSMGLDTLPSDVASAHRFEYSALDDYGLASLEAGAWRDLVLDMARHDDKFQQFR